MSYHTSPSPKNYKYFCLMTAILVTVSLCDIILVYRPVKLGGFLFSGGTFIMPLYYYLTDAIAEVYGYRYCRQAIWIMFFCCLCFSLLITGIIHLPATASGNIANAIQQSYSHLWRTVFGGTLVTVLIGTFVNSFIISKWKILLNGKYFWMRSLGASAAGEFIEVSTECFLLYIGFIPFTSVITMIIPTFIMHMIIGLIIIYPGALLAQLLKNLEKADVFDRDISFTPFQFRIEDNAKETKFTSTTF